MTSTSTGSRLPRTDVRSSPTRLMLRWAVPSGLVLTGVGVLVAWLVQDGAAALSALVGGLLSLAVFGLGIVAIRGLLSGPGQIVMSGAFFVFLVQIAVTAGVLFLLGRADQVSLMALGVTFIAVGLAVQAGTVMGALRARVSVDPAAGAASASVAPTRKEVER